MNRDDPLFQASAFISDGNAVGLRACLTQRAWGTSAMMQQLLKSCLLENQYHCAQVMVDCVTIDDSDGLLTQFAAAHGQGKVVQALLPSVLAAKLSTVAYSSAKAGHQDILDFVLHHAPPENIAQAWATAVRGCFDSCSIPLLAWLTTHPQAIEHDASGVMLEAFGRRIMESPGLGQLPPYIDVLPLLLRCATPDQLFDHLLPSQEWEALDALAQLHPFPAAWCMQILDKASSGQCPAVEAQLCAHDLRASLNAPSTPSSRPHRL